MYIRIKKTPRSKSISVQIVESFRINGKGKQCVIRHIGTADNEEKLIALKKLAETIKHELEHKKLTRAVSNASVTFGQGIGKTFNIPEGTSLSKNLEELERRILGIHDIYGYVFDKVGFSNPFTWPSRTQNVARILREIVLARIACPKSKRGSVELLATQFGIKLKLDNVYQMMDKIDEAFCERIQSAALATTLNLIKGKLRVIFYDTTTLYFESFSEDDLKQNGYSKDMKFNQPQVLFALFVTEAGLPIGYELFPGATFEGHTLVPVLEKLKRRYDIEKIIFVADRGLLSDDNLEYLAKNNFEYVVGARLKNLPKKMQKNILDKSNYIPHGEQQIAAFTYQNRKLIVSYSDERAKKDQYDRDKSIEKLAKKLSKSSDPKSMLNNYGYKKYLKINGNASFELNAEKATSDSAWDGLTGIFTNVQDLNVEQILSHYRTLWQIEDCFRINKHDLKIRPIYHWTPHRVKAHIAITFMAFVCIRYLEYRLTLQSQRLSPEVIRNSLLQVQASIIRDNENKHEYLLASNVNANAKEIYRILRIKLPQSLMALKRNA